MAKTVRVYIDGDAKGAVRATKQTEQALAGLGKKGGASLGGLKTAAISAGLGFGAAGLALGLKESVDAFRQAEKAQASFVGVLKTMGLNTAAATKNINAVVQAQSKLSGFDDEALLTSYTKFLAVTKDQTEATHANALAMDLARGRGISLQVATKILEKVYAGSTTALNRYGFSIEKGTSVTAALAQVQTRYAGQARAYGDTSAGAADKASVAFENLQETVGSKLAPALNSLSGGILKVSDATGSLVDQAGGLGPVLAGAAGFGAFATLDAPLGKFAGKLGTIGKAFGSGQGIAGKLGAAGYAARGLVTPFGAGAVAATLLGAGIYEIVTNSDPAQQALDRLNQSLADLEASLKNNTTAHDILKQSQLNVRTSARDEAAAIEVSRNASARAAAAHRTAKAATDAAGDALQKHGSKSKEFTRAKTDEQAAIRKATAADKDAAKAHDAARAATLAHERATHDLTNAKKTSKSATEAANKSERDAIKNGQEFVTLAAATSRGYTRAYGAVQQAIETSGNSLATFVQKTRNSTTTGGRLIHNYAVKFHEIPNVKQTALIIRASAAGKTLDDIKGKLDRLRDKSFTVRYNTLITGSRPNPVTGARPTKKAGGGFVSGRFSQGDIVPAMLSGEEVVLNPGQQGLVDSGYSISEALSMTNAPHSGSSFASGKKPSPSAQAAAALRRRDPKNDVRSSVNPVSVALARKQSAYEFQLAKHNRDIVFAQGTETASDDITAYSQDNASRSAYLRYLGRVLRDPSKTLGLVGAKLTREQRTSLINQQAEIQSAINDNARSIFELQHPDTDTSSGSGPGSGADGSASSAADDSDLQARLAQAVAQRDVANRGLGLSEAALSVFGGPGDIGTGGYSSALGAAKGAALTIILGDARSAEALAQTATQGMARQSTITSPRLAVNA